MDAYTIFAPADEALTITIGSAINEQTHQRLLSLEQKLRMLSDVGIRDVVVSYHSLTVLYDAYALSLRYPSPKRQMESLITQALSDSANPQEKNVRLVTIPVCYDEEFAPDLRSVAESRDLSIDEIIRLHTAQSYRVYLIGFLPGFAYMASLPKELVVPRHEKPRAVVTGSVGLAGIQTGIYPVDSPGGWQIIGRTPAKMFDRHKSQPSTLNVGDRVQFQAISKSEFIKMSDAK